MRKQMADFHDAILTSRQNEPGQSKRPPRGQDSTIDELWEARSALNAIDWEHKGLSRLRQEVMDDMSDGRWRPKSMDITQAKTPKYLRLAKDILRSLNFDHMYKRHDDISKPFESTFKWIWHGEPTVAKDTGRPRWSSFPAWLEGSGATAYWVTGKPGSGKSTLLRSIEDHDNLRKHLSQWKSSLPLRILSFYAWNPGSDPQKSIDGLVRTILSQALKDSPDLLPLVLPRRWAFETTLWGSNYPSDWEFEDMASLEEGLGCFLSESQSRMKLMILVDGLDEFNVAPKELIKTIESISRHGNVKLCVASRPWTEFRDRFGLCPQLEIHNLTAGDIQTYIFEQFQACPASLERPAVVAHLREKIQEQAGGVFQWVTVVVSFLLTMLSEGDSLSLLLGTLNRLPEELSDLYTAIWGRISSLRRTQAQDIFVLQSAAHVQSLHFLVLWAVNERHSTEPGLLMETAKDPESIRKSVMRTLHSHTLGLLELDPRGFVSFLHRTVPEWLDKMNVLRDSALQPDLAFLQGLCNLGGHIPAKFKLFDHVLWGEHLQKTISYHTSKIAAQPSLPAKMTEDAVTWLEQLEKDLDFSIVWDACHYLYDGGRGSIVHAATFINMIAACGFTPFVTKHLQNNQGSPSDTLFFFCMHRPLQYVSQHTFDLPETPLEPRLGLLRLCLQYGMTPHRLVEDRGAGSIHVCSLKDLVSDARTMSRRQSLHPENHQYYTLVADTLEEWMWNERMKINWPRMKLQPGWKQRLNPSGTLFMFQRSK